MSNTNTSTATTRRHVTSATQPHEITCPCGLDQAGYLKEVIDTLYTELRVRESAASHLRGIPAKQNQSRIDTLYDLLNHAHIAALAA